MPTKFPFIEFNSSREIVNINFLKILFDVLYSVHQFVPNLRSLFHVKIVSISLSIALVFIKNVFAVLVSILSFLQFLI